MPIGSPWYRPRAYLEIESQFETDADLDVPARRNGTKVAVSEERQALARRRLREPVAAVAGSEAYPHANKVAQVAGERFAARLWNVGLWEKC